MVDQTYFTELANPPAPQLTTYAKNKILDHILRGVSISIPITWYLGLLYDRSGLANGGQPTNEFTHPSYHRDTMSIWKSGNDVLGMTGYYYTSPTQNRTATNPAWGEFPAMALFDAETGGNCWFWFTYSRDSQDMDGTQHVRRMLKYTYYHYFALRLNL